MAIFIAQGLHRQGWRQGTVKCVTCSFRQARHASGTTSGSGSCSSGDEESEDSMSSVVGACLRFKLEISGIVEGNAAFGRIESERSGRK